MTSIFSFNISTKSSIQTALDKILDISEADIISLLQIVVAHHRQLDSNTNAMQVDSDHVPALPPFLSKCILLNTTPVALRLAVRQHLNDAEDLVCILEVLDGWLDVWSSQEIKLLLGNIKKRRNGDVPVLNATEQRTAPGPPPFTKVILHLSTDFLLVLIILRRFYLSFKHSLTPPS